MLWGETTTFTDMLSFWRKKIAEQRATTSFHPAICACGSSAQQCIKKNWKFKAMLRITVLNSVKESLYKIEVILG